MKQLASTDPSKIASAAQCFSCNVTGINDLAVRTYLLGQLGNAATPPCTTPTAPTQPTAFIIGSTTLNISWTQPGNTGSFISTYTLKWGTTPGGPYNVGSITVGAAKRSAIATGLTQGTQYYFVVVANSSAGCSSANSAEGTATTSSSGGACGAGVTFANAWSLRVQTNGGAAPSNATLTAIATFQCGLITDGLDTMMIGWNAIASDNLIAARTPQLLGGGNDPWGDSVTPLNAGNLSAKGLTVTAGNNTGMNSGLSPTAIYASDGDAGLTYYLSAGAAAFAASCFGNGRSGANGFDIIPNFPAFGFFFECWASNGGCPDRINNAGFGNFNGYVSCNRTSTNAVAAYNFNSTTPHGVIGSCAGATATTRFNAPIWAILDQALGGGACPGSFGFFGIHHGLTQAQSALFAARIQTLMTSFSRQV